MGQLQFMYVLNDILYTVHTSELQAQKHIAQNYTLLIIHDGTGKLLVDGQQMNLVEGKCIILPPNATMTISTGHKGLCLYQLTFAIIDVEHLMQHNASPLFTVIEELQCSPFSQCLNLLEAIYRNRLASDELVRFEQHIRFQELMLFILQQNSLEHQPQGDRQSVEQSINYLHKHYDKDLMVEQLADLVKVPRWKYTRLFKEITGQIPLHYLNSIRIERAKQLLITTNDRIFEISQTVGFNNEYYFNRRFKEHVGISPGQYRRNQSKNIRVFAPFLEDFLVALGITPIAQFSHSKWGKQEYLGLGEVPDIDVENGQMEQLFKYKPHFIMLDAGVERWHTYNQLNQLAPTYHLSHPGEDWRSTLYKIADLTGRMDIMKDVVKHYEQKVKEAKKILNKSVYGQTVAFLRISAKDISIYAGPECGYTGPILYRDLGLMPPSLVWSIPQRTRKSSLTFEQLQQLDADHLFITFDKQLSIVEGEERNILDSSSWKALSAVKNHCVYEVDFLTWMNYGILSHSKKIDDVLNVLG